MTIHVRKSAMRVADVLYYSGWILVALSVPLLYWRIAHGTPLTLVLASGWIISANRLLIPGVILVLAGRALINHLYHCPNCKKKFLTLETFSRRHTDTAFYCVWCGTKITVCFEKKQ